MEEAIADIHDDYESKSGKYHYYDATTQLPTTEKYASTGMWFPRPNQQATIDAFKRAVANGRTHLLTPCNRKSAKIKYRIAKK